MINYCTPEQAGISSANVLQFYQGLANYKLSTHSVILMRGNSIFSECYYAPFDEHFKHRLYSASKTFVAVAIGFCEQDGLLSLDDPMVKYFPEYVNEKTDDIMRTLTIREMLLMRTAFEHACDWFTSGTTDRTEVYFRKGFEKYPDTFFDYDSPGSYMLCVIVENLTGKPLLEYLKDKILRRIGFSEDAYCIQAPGGHSFGDSGVMCTSRDLLKFARFVMNKGTWEGERFLNQKFLDDATDMSHSNDYFGFESHCMHGYGYQIWGAPRGCYAMIGMGGQFAFCDPAHDLIAIITSDNQGSGVFQDQIYESLYHNIIDQLNEDASALPENADAQKALLDYTSSQKLFFVDGKTESAFSEKINGKRFVCAENPMKIKWFTLTFKGDEATLHYENEQGEKSFSMGFGHNVFAKFPQEGYSDLIATYRAPGNYYDAAFSADWIEPQKLRIRVQIIDKYFGNLAMVFGFCDENTVSVKMVKQAEAFLNEYRGIMNAKAQ